MRFKRPNKKEVAIKNMLIIFTTNICQKYILTKDITKFIFVYIN